MLHTLSATYTFLGRQLSREKHQWSFEMASDRFQPLSSFVCGSHDFPEILVGPVPKKGGIGQPSFPPASILWNKPSLWHSLLMQHQRKRKHAQQHLSCFFGSRCNGSVWFVATKYQFIFADITPSLALWLTFAASPVLSQGQHTTALLSCCGGECFWFWCSYRKLDFLRCCWLGKISKPLLLPCVLMQDTWCIVGFP